MAREFVTTIADDASDVPELDVDDDIEPVEAQKPTKSGKGKKPIDMNPTFSFSTDGDLEALTKSSTLFKKGAKAVWDFDAVKGLMKSKKSSASLDDLIARRRSEAQRETDDESEGEVVKEDQSENGGDESAPEEDVAEEVERDLEYTREQPEDDATDKRKADFFAPTEETAAGTEIEYQSFTEMNLSRPIQKGLTDVGFVKPTRIQSMTIPIALMGKDICGGAVTGSGKTAAFLIPILERLLYRPKSTAATRVLILTPTRELAAQCHSVAVKLAKYTDIAFCLCVGGMATQQQEAELRKRPDVVIATPGRLIDHVRNSASFGLDSIEILVMDEADRMLEEGFQAELDEVIKECPRQRQTLLFSATMTDNVDQLISLSLQRPVRLFIDSTRSVATKLVQEFIRVRIPEGTSSKAMESVTLRQRESILLALCTRTYRQRCIIFFQSKAHCHRMKILFGLYGLKAAELHGNLSQLQRIEALEKFRDGDADFLLATDLASRGLDIAGIETVINFQMPVAYDRYVHRVGRTARYERGGKAVTLVAEKDRKMMKMVLKYVQAGQVVKQRLIPSDVIQKYRQKISVGEKQITQVMRDERDDKEMQAAERDLTKAENMVTHADEIFSRPARTWFQSEKDKQAQKNGNKDVKEEPQLTEKQQEFAAVMAKEFKRGKFDGMSRKQKRRRQIMEEDGKEFDQKQKKQKFIAKAAKKAAKGGPKK